MICVTRRDDIFVSICFPQMPEDQDALHALQVLAKLVDRHYRYWEILLINDSGDRAIEDAAIQSIANLRVLHMRGHAQMYHKRVAAAVEAIGDIVVIGSLDEIGSLDIPAMIETCRSTSALVMGQRTRSGFFLNSVLMLLGRASGFRVTTLEMLTAVFPRTLLNRILKRHDRQIALRFPPRDSAVNVLYQKARATDLQRRSMVEIGRRINLVQKLLVHSAPKVLSIVSLLSVVVVIFAVFYFLYAVFVWLTFISVQPGWFTTSLVLSFSISFLGAALFGLATGMQQLIELLSPDSSDDIIGERSRTDLFVQVKHDLNVEVATPLVSSEVEGYQVKPNRRDDAV